MNQHLSILMRWLKEREDMGRLSIGFTGKLTNLRNDALRAAIEALSGEAMVRYTITDKGRELLKGRE